MIGNERRTTLTTAKRRAIKAAKDFGYGTDCIKKLMTASSIEEVLKIMKSAREEL